MLHSGAGGQRYLYLALRCWVVSKEVQNRGMPVVDTMAPLVGAGSVTDDRHARPRQVCHTMVLYDCLIDCGIEIGESVKTDK